MKALMWTQCLVMLVLTVVTRSEVAMKQEKKFVGASGDGDEVVLSCEANDLPEECKFYRCVTSSSATLSIGCCRGQPTLSLHA